MYFHFMKNDVLFYLYSAHTIQINKDVKVLYLATRLALVDSHPELFSYDEIVDASLCTSLKISAEDLSSAAEFASKEAENILKIMNAKFFTR